MVIKFKSYLFLGLLVILSGAIKASSEALGIPEDNSETSIDVCGDRFRCESFELPIAEIAKINTPPGLIVNICEADVLQPATFKSNELRHARFSVYNRVLTGESLDGGWGRLSILSLYALPGSRFLVGAESEVEVFGKIETIED